jgi:acrylyl-CoA reductase (NADPH)/3-hydroxypropionyl-CoA dehydratase/3-hydroxypropionyl-CoA synthetase
MWLVGTVTFFLSAVLDNLTTAIVMVSLMKKLLQEREDRLFFAGIIVIAANAGGAWSPIGDVTTLKNPESLDELRRVISAWERKQRLSADQDIFDRYRYFRIQYNTVAPGKKVATVFITNPPVNALNERAIDELVIVVEHLSRRDDVAAVVFTGDGTASFVAGADIRQFLDEIHTVEEARVLPANAQLAFGKIEQMGKPCIAAIQGVALGGGMEFALACHYRVAETTARFGQPEIRLRLLPRRQRQRIRPRLGLRVWWCPCVWARPTMHKP